MTDENGDEVTAAAWCAKLGHDEQPVYHITNCLGIRWAPWMGDWFVSWSPRNSDIEGTWDHWIDLSLLILSDPLTEIVRPAVYMPLVAKKVVGFGAESHRYLTYAELRARFDTGSAS
jgi:hypothetical protein